MKIAIDILIASWNLFQQAAVYMLFGFFLAGILYVFVKPETIAYYLGDGRIRSVFLSALVGIPIPLCSCGVVPAAASLKKQGANSGATLSFLIATPETGVDSIPLTYALMDPLMTVARPVAAFITSIVAGLAENFFDRSKKFVPLSDQNISGSNFGRSGSQMTSPAEPSKNPSFSSQMRSGLKFAFVDLLGDIGGWFILGILLAGLISYFVPNNFMDSFLRNRFSAMLAMLLAGIPMYVCATSSTPIAAALVLKGLNPGAALVFLLAGPATNIASLSMVSRFLGKRALIIYVGSIAICSLALGLFTDMLYDKLGISAQAIAGHGTEIFPPALELSAALILAGLIAYAVWNQYNRRNACSAGCKIS